MRIVRWVVYVATFSGFCHRATRRFYYLKQKEPTADSPSHRQAILNNASGKFHFEKIWITCLCICLYLFNSEFYLHVNLNSYITPADTLSFERAHHRLSYGYEDSEIQPIRLICAWTISEFYDACLCSLRQLDAKKLPLENYVRFSKGSGVQRCDKVNDKGKWNKWEIKVFWAETARACVSCTHSI